jgi:hypothetical protein
MDPLDHSGEQPAPPPAPVRHWVSRYTFTAAPAWYPVPRHYEIHVEAHPGGQDLWRIRHGDYQVLSQGGHNWVHPSDDRAGLFDLAAAFEHAERWAPDVEANGVKARDVKRREGKR